MRKMREKTIAVLLVTILALSFMGAFVPVSAATLQVGPTKLYSKIQDALDAASAGDTIEIYPFTSPYAEDLSIIVDDLWIVGFGLSVVDGVATGTGLSAPANVWINADGVDIVGMTFNSPILTAGQVSGGMIVNGTDISIHDNEFWSYGVGENVAIQTLAATNDGNVAGLEIYDNTFDGSPTIGYIGIYVNPDLDDSGEWVHIVTNVMTGYVKQGIITERNQTRIDLNTIVTDQPNTIYGNGIGAYGSNPSLVQELSDVEILNNVVTGSGTGLGFNRGIFTGWLEYTQTDISIHHNTVEGNNYGVLVRVTASGVSVNYNNLENNNVNVANTVSGETLDATLNWWGRPDIVGIITGTQGNIDADPWLDGKWNVGASRTSVGVTGSTGPQGVPGDTGDQGVPGLTGADGDTGLTGATGPFGATGATGPRGSTGPEGDRGSRGSTGPTGPGGPQGMQGVQGIDGNATGIQGETGATGPMGSQGIQGIQGLLGETGQQGPQGESVQGPQGEVGVGSQGPQGDQGEPGLRGQQGDPAPALVSYGGIGISLLGLLGLYFKFKP